MTDENGSNNAGSGEPLDAFTERFTLYMDVVAMFHELVNYIHDGIDLMEGGSKRRIVATFGELIIRQAAEDTLQQLSLEKGGGQHGVQILGWHEDSLKGECDVE